MMRFVVRRLLWTFPTLFVISFLVFVALRVGTDPVQSYLRLNPRASQAKVQQYREANGLVGSIVEQYFTWLRHFLTFNWGRSIKGSRPVWPELKSAMGNTLLLGVLSTVVGIVVGLGIGIACALRPRSLVDQTSTTAAFVGISVPPFVAAILLQLFFAVILTRWFGLDKPLLPTSGVYPAGHKGFNLVLRLKHLILPIVVVSIQVIAVYSRYMRASLIEVSTSDYLRTARAKGLSERRILVRHALRNALIPIVTVAALNVGSIIGGLIVTERIFENRGMGDFFLTAFQNGDFPQLMPYMVFVVLGVVLANLLADVLYAVLDPRIRLE
jgi:peptide/nickel transport system permease protein